MVKHVEGYTLKKSINKDYNVYVRSFSGAKVKYIFLNWDSLHARLKLRGMELQEKEAQKG